MASCLSDGCESSPITGSGYCLKHWIDMRYGPILAFTWIAGLISGYSKYLFWIGLIFTVLIMLAYRRTGKEVDSLQEAIYEHGVPGD